MTAPEATGPEAAGDAGFLEECPGLARAWGADLAGLATVAGRPAVSLAVGLSRAVMEGVALARGPTPSYAHHYRTVNAFLDQVALRLARALETRGFEAMPVPASQYEDEAALLGAFPHKTAAVAAGLGWIGRSGLLLVPGLGPRVRLATVLLGTGAGAAAASRADAKPGAVAAAPGPAGSGPGPGPAALTGAASGPGGGLRAPRPHPCAGCRACVEGCPAGAISGHLWSPGLPREEMVDVRRCADWMASRHRVVGGEICGLCISLCPRGRRAP